MDVVLAAFCSHLLHLQLAAHRRPAFLLTWWLKQSALALKPLWTSYAQALTQTLTQTHPLAVQMALLVPVVLSVVWTGPAHAARKSRQVGPSAATCWALAHCSIGLSCICLGSNQVGNGFSTPNCQQPSWQGHQSRSYSACSTAVDKRKPGHNLGSVRPNRYICCVFYLLPHRLLLHRWCRRLHPQLPALWSSCRPPCRACGSRSHTLAARQQKMQHSRHRFCPVRLAHCSRSWQLSWRSQRCVRA